MLIEDTRLDQKEVGPSDSGKRQPRPACRNMRFSCARGESVTIIKTATDHSLDTI